MTQIKQDLGRMTLKTKTILTIAVFLFTIYNATPALADCSDPITRPLIVDVPAKASASQTASIVAAAVVDTMNSTHPASSRCGTVIYDIRVIIKIGFWTAAAVPYVGEIKDNENWEDVLPGQIYEYYDIDPDAQSSTSSRALSCGDGCMQSYFSDVDPWGVEYEVYVTYASSFSCNSAGCTLTLSVIDVQVFVVNDGSQYLGLMFQQTTLEPALDVS